MSEVKTRVKKASLFTNEVITLLSSKMKTNDEPVAPSFILGVLKGDISSDDIKTFENYSAIYHIRHDAIHWLICQERDYEFGERSMDSLINDEKVINHKNWSLVKKQSPDMVRIRNNKVLMVEITVSSAKDPEGQKLSKYAMLIQLLKDCGYVVDVEIISISVIYSMPDRIALAQDHGFSESLIDGIALVILNVDHALLQANQHEQAAEWRAKMLGKLLENIHINITDDDVLRFHEGCSTKTFNSQEDLEFILKDKEPMRITKDDDKFIDDIVDMTIGIKTKLTTCQDIKIAINELQDFHDKHTNVAVPHPENRSFMPLPYFERLKIDSSERHTWDDNQLTEYIKGRLKDCSDPVLSKIGHLQGVMSTLKFSKEDKFTIALQGPNRKHFVRIGSKEHIKAHLKHKNMWLPLNSQFDSHISNIIKELSRITNWDDTLDPNKMTGKGLDYIRICQSIFREININAMRKERRHNHILRPTGVDGVYVFLHAGPKLRTGEGLSIIWFKIILDAEIISYDPILSQSWVFKRLHRDKMIYHSNFLSTDANRLDHYIRCFDKILMAYATYCSYGSKPLSLIDHSQSGDILGVIIMIYMEDKRSTSKMLQDSRYLVMTSLSMFPYYIDIIGKFKEPLRTPLQVYLLNMMLVYATNPHLPDIIRKAKFGALSSESSTGEFLTKFSGTNIMLPRLLSKGDHINFRQMLCEMYFTMLFNKNQDDPTHASFQILSKILEGEESLEHVKNTTKLHTGFYDSDLTDAKTLIDHPHKNQFSRRAIMIASKLQSISRFNHGSNGISHKIASQSNEINKYLDEFATFKSSSTVQNLYLSEAVLVDPKKDEFETSDQQGTSTQNKRIRCLEGVNQLLEMNYMRSFDLIRNHLTEPFYFQIFKKNQIGGVREILILDIKKRVLVNILESFSRVICSDDDREMLTHGDRKFSLLRDILQDLRRGTEKTLIMNYNFDKTRWGPSFMPIQFLYMFYPFKEYYPSLFRFIAISLINHSNKEFILPEKLISAWINDPLNVYKHRMDENLQRLKETFLLTKKLSYVNESNMGQGILHYTSSFFHLCVLSFRDEIYVRLCDRFKVAPGEWRDMVSSDDSYTAQALKLSKSPKLARLRILLLMKAQEVSERLLNVWTSTSKSSISALVYEFNSLFGSNMTMYPTTLKFSLAAVHPVNTDSFFRMVKESFIACRQVVENGGSLELYVLASKMNKIYCEQIYHTNTGGVNDPCQLNLRREYLPYQIGIYPIMDPAIMLMFGPECHNYNIIRNQQKMDRREDHIFKVMHSLVKLQDPELYASFDKVDSVFSGLHRIEAHMGPVRRLEQLKNKLKVDREGMIAYIVSNPMMLFQDPINMEELKIKVHIKLFQGSASEALRTTAASIYYARVSATVSAKIFHIPMVNYEPQTYLDCVRSLLSISSSQIDLNTLYPHTEEFNNLYKLALHKFEYKDRSDVESQSIRNLQLNQFQQRVRTPVVKLLNFFWDNEQLSRAEEIGNQLRRDWYNLKKIMPTIADTLDQTIKNYKYDTKEERVQAFLLTVLRLMGSSSKPMKAIIYGQSSRSYDSSYLILKQQNMYTNKTTNFTTGMNLTDETMNPTDKLSFAYNMFVLSLISLGKPISVNQWISETQIEDFLLDNYLSPSSYKKILTMLIYNGYISEHNITRWSIKTHTIFHRWVRKQQQLSYTDVDPITTLPVTKYRYSGNFILTLQLADVKLTLMYRENQNPNLRIFCSSLANSTIVAELIEKGLLMTGLSMKDLPYLTNHGYFEIQNGQLVTLIAQNGFSVIVRELLPVKLQPHSIHIENDFVILSDDRGEEVVKSALGLLHSDYVPSDEEKIPHFKIGGIDSKKLLPLRPFNIEFDIENFDDNHLCDLLDDLIVEKPSITDVTRKRLGIKFRSRDLSYEYSDALIESKEPAIDHSQLMADLMRAEVTMEMVDLALNDMPETGNYHDTWLHVDSEIGLLLNTTKYKINYQPRRIFERVMGLKYSIIARMTTETHTLNKRTIKNLYENTKNVNIYYSLIYVYDHMYTNLESQSPGGYYIKMSPIFSDKFQLETDDTLPEL